LFSVFILLTNSKAQALGNIESTGGFDYHVLF